MELVVRGAARVHAVRAQAACAPRVAPGATTPAPLRAHLVAAGSVAPSAAPSAAPSVPVGSTSICPGSNPLCVLLLQS